LAKKPKLNYPKEVEKEALEQGREKRIK